MDRDFPCPKKRGEIQNIQSSNGSRVPDTLWDIFTGGEHGYCTNKLHLSDQANQPQQMSCRQPDRDRKSKSAQQIQTDAPIAIRNGAGYINKIQQSVWSPMRHHINPNLLWRARNNSYSWTSNQTNINLRFARKFSWFAISRLYFQSNTLQWPLSYVRSSQQSECN